ncbi:hypothetical protein Pmar_PMAR007378 [Perkinsus marinus ATCC 50983]|uniref:Uncharacterized protein n=1 Tax=Perkinsus marinus (strain ATCC 50983 / TXsc) TaxID=423536 RepID=C5K663_PERM5|nr:hypothetical protein Pmar_PMAR007378 [Perkinsus marinus ATCC 50983]EER20093.1 hypothetical protein Pmar_PMAR007378 [Perkinsus marinus ATCC 50983]|eukprot:XP_002788297.1 hypothetical protein Pmar_PMAR007378 [Perkinsus marinus ATCC 50983]
MRDSLRVQLKAAKRGYSNAIKAAKRKYFTQRLESMDEIELHRRFKPRTPTLATYDDHEILEHFFGITGPPDPQQDGSGSRQAIDNLEELGGNDEACTLSKLL